MASLEQYVHRVKPALDDFLRTPTMTNVSALYAELSRFDMMEMKLFHMHILLPLVIKLGELDGCNQDLHTETINCIRVVVSKQFLTDLVQLKTILVVVLNNLRLSDGVATKPNLSEELKLAAVLCITEVLQHATTDVLEQFYTKESQVLLGQILLTLVEFIEKEKYRKLVISSMHCLMNVFYVSDEDDFSDVVLRNQVAESLFIYIPKIITVLNQICLGDEMLGETLKATAVCALGRILWIIYEGTNESSIARCYDKSEFRKLWSTVCEADSNMSTKDSNDDILGSRRVPKEMMGERLQRLQDTGRTSQWFAASSQKLRIIFQQTSNLRSHRSARLRLEFARMCCNLIQHCTRTLETNFVFLLENVVSMSEDKEEHVRELCRQQLQKLQRGFWTDTSIFDETADFLLDAHLTKLPRIIKRSNDEEQCCELMFICGFVRNMNESKLCALLSIPKNMELFCMCLLNAIELNISSDLLIEEHSLRLVDATTEYAEYAKLPWRRFKNMNSHFAVQIIQDICGIVGSRQMLNYMLFDFLHELLLQQTGSMNEIILLMLWIATSKALSDADKTCEKLRNRLLLELLKESHWHLALLPDHVWRLKVDKPSNWFVDRTPGLYESAVEVRTQDCDSDDENDVDNVYSQHRVTITDAEFNVLHTCIVLDGLAHCAISLGDNFDRYTYSSLCQVLLKVSSSNVMVHQAATFALISIQQSLGYASISDMIEVNMDYLANHLNRILKMTPGSRSAVDMLIVVLQFSRQKSFHHLAGMFQTIRDECVKACQAENINGYLKVFSAFLAHLTRSQLSYVSEKKAMLMEQEYSDVELLNLWTSVLHRKTPIDNDVNFDTNVEMTEKVDQPMTETNDDNSGEEEKPKLPYDIEMIKDIINHVLKFLSSTEKMHQILALECLNFGIPLLSDYEDELLPQVHLIWQPLLEKFRQNDAIVLNRCFTLLNTLATYAKEFISKRCLDDVIPSLKRFLKEAAVHSASKRITAKTQEYKLQIILLKKFSNLIQCMQIDGKPLNEIADVISLYLSENQPKELQQLALQFYNSLRHYDGPFVYLGAKKLSNTKNYEKNASIVLSYFGVETRLN